jgi:hypothetical protein
MALYSPSELAEKIGILPPNVYVYHKRGKLILKKHKNFKGLFFNTDEPLNIQFLENRGMTVWELILKS